ncbi:hypothetical protein MATL_G00159260 [Megalops atlanticus]|uniref:Uncharacterized protein n=1 Tax=Megalops atlanticus TaxID=7932 RepID=A0A9D3PQQ5_MEGAT|nr:hypothetical protein MATL_G00159260 [Megalops atlanticus]
MNTGRFGPSFDTESACSESEVDASRGPIARQRPREVGAPRAVEGRAQTSSAGRKPDPSREQAARCQVTYPPREELKVQRNTWLYKEAPASFHKQRYWEELVTE